MSESSGERGPERLEVDARFEGDGLLDRLDAFAAGAGRADAQGAPETLPSLGGLAQALLNAEILDTRSVALPGAAVTLPWGMALVRRFRGLLEPLFAAAGYEEFDIPNLIPHSALEPALAAFPDVQNLLMAGDAADWAAGRSRAVLTPTGEAAVYTHWARTVRRADDLPIKLHRRATYFRPVPRGSHSGRGVFRPLEAPEVHEFHACFADRGSAAAGLGQALELAKAACAAMHVPTVWSVRPPWTNNGEIAEVCYGGDALLPSGGTVQVGCVYDQGQRFSRVYQVKMRDRRDDEYPYQIAGAVTRRLLLTHLFQQLDADGRVRLHPDVSPVEVAVHGTGGEHVDRLAESLRRAGVRVDSRVHERSQAVKAQHAQWRRRGIPVIVLIQAPRTDGDRIRVVISGVGDDAVQLIEDVARVRQPVLDELRRCADAAQARSAELTAVRIAAVDGHEDLDRIIGARGVGVVPLEPTRDAVAAVEARHVGEVIGLRRAASSGRCVASGVETQVRALVGVRA